MNDILTLWNEGAGQQEIADRVGCKTKDVSQVLARAARTGKTVRHAKIVPNRPYRKPRFTAVAMYRGCTITTTADTMEEAEWLSNETARGRPGDGL